MASAQRRTERDDAITVFAWDLEGVTSAHIRRRFFHNSRSKTPSSERVAYLVGSRFLTVVGRLPVPGGVGSGKRVLVPGPAAYPLLARLRGVSRAELAAQRRSLAPGTLGHHVALVDVWLGLTLACDQSAVFSLHAWKTDRAWHRQPLRLQAARGGKALTLIPDGSFQLALPDGTRHPFFVEMDMGQMTAARMRRKLAAYLTLPPAPSGLPIPVLIVTTTPQRLGQLAAWSVAEAASLGVPPSRIWLILKEDVTEETILTERVLTLAGREQPVAFTDITPFAHASAVVQEHADAAAR